MEWRDGACLHVWVHPYQFPSEFLYHARGAMHLLFRSATRNDKHKGRVRSEARAGGSSVFLATLNVIDENYVSDFWV